MIEASFDADAWRLMGWFSLRVGDRVLVTADNGPVMIGTVTDLNPEPGNTLTIGLVTVEGTDMAGYPLEAQYWMNTLALHYWQPSNESSRPPNPELPVPDDVWAFWSECQNEGDDDE